MTHPEAGYTLAQLPDGEAISTALEACRLFALRRQIRLGFHPDQFVVLSPPHENVMKFCVGIFSAFRIPAVNS
jgi:UV DNA damage endonuclease